MTTFLDMETKFEIEAVSEITAESSIDASVEIPFPRTCFSLKS